MSSTTLPIIEKAPNPPGGSASGAGDAPEAPASENKAKKKFRAVCSICKKPNHTAAVCRNNPNNFTIVAGGSKWTPPGTVIQWPGAAPAGVKKNKKKGKKDKKAEKKTEAVAAKAAEQMEM